MQFEVELTERADRDLRNIFLYIAVDLNAPENVERQINRLWDAILSLLMNYQNDTAVMKLNRGTV